MKDLTHGRLPGHILAMALPIAVGMLVQTLYYLVDLYFVSRLGDTALAGVSAAGNIVFLVMALIQVLNVGTISLVSHAVGREDQERANLVFNQAVTLAAFLAVVTLAAGYLGPADRYLASVAADAATVAAGATYLHWFILALAMHFLIAAMGAALQGTGIVKPAMLIQMLTVLLNIILTPVLVAGWITGHPMGVAGAGLSTALAVLVGVVLMLFYYFRLERYVKFSPGLWRPRFDVLRRMLAVGLPSGGEFLLMFIYLGVIYAVISEFGATGQAGFGVGIRVMQAVFLPSMAVAFAVPAIAGQNFGAGLIDRVRATFRMAATMSVAIMIGATLFAKWRPELLVAPFSSDPEVLRVAAGFLRIISWNFAAQGLIFTCSGMFQAMGNTLPALLSSATRLVTFVVPAFWLASRPGFYIEQVWYVSVATVTLQAVMSLSLLAWQFRRRLRLDAAGGEAAAQPA